VTQPATQAGRTALALELATQTLLGELNAAGHWEGQLSSSALSTATAATALHFVDAQRFESLVAAGLRWLAENQNPDGGWGDTVRSKSNISTTALAWAAFGAAGADARHSSAVAGAQAWMARACGGGPLCREALFGAIERRYGKDRTFSVPILMMCTLAGRLGPHAWRSLFALPFEISVLPHRFFGALRLPVVSYALPALIAIGQVIHHYAPSRFPPLRTLRDALREPALRVLEGLQPENGGFLEATPLTSFVAMALAGAGRGDHPVARRAVGFLEASVRSDGSWPIDTNLSTWTSTLAIKALAHQPGALSSVRKLQLRRWLLSQQFRREHPYTHAAPGGWAWTDLPGGVPDADDTPGALLALRALGENEPPDRESLAAAEDGVRWLLDLQNGDGGIPTFCRGWGALPFDRSSPDLTAHTLRAWHAWAPRCPEKIRKRIARATRRALRFLCATQRADGSWVPLWFGNEHASCDENPVYGAAHVLIALRDIGENEIAPRAMHYLANAQNADGGWGGAKGAPSSIEETALAVEALAGADAHSGVHRGIAWLARRVLDGSWTEPAPIGLYFARLWYFEKLYPIIWTVGALGKARQAAMPAH
jgi:squalene-hopene/tetraprenyl-beta-curcumene cyclase